MTHLCVVATPWVSPAFLSRGRCLWELFCAVERGVPPTLCMPAADREKLRRSGEAAIEHAASQLAPALWEALEPSRADRGLTAGGTA
eukprot:5864750-Prymnesium_polylepis.1